MSNNVTIGIQTSFQDAGIQAAKRELARLVAAQQQAAKSTASSGIAATNAERGLVQYASALARSQAAAGNAAGGMQTLTAALENVNRASASALRAQTQLATLQARVEQGTSAFGRMSSAVQGLNSTLGAFGAALGVQQVAQFAVSAVQAANTLERTQATVSALSGSQERYNQVLDLARQGQQKYGGSLSDTLEGLGSLVNLSNRTSVSLGQLDAVSRRLAIVDPVQGIKGATIALKEFLTGSDQTAIISLARRFELPKTALRELTSETLSTQQKLDALDRVLAEQGITMDVLNNRTQTTAATYDRLGASFDNAKVAIGGLIAVKLAPWAREIGEELGVVAHGLNEMQRATQQLPMIAATALSGADSFEQYQQRIGLANEKLAQIGMAVQPLTQAQFNLAQSFMQTGMSAEQAAAKAQQMNDVLVRIGEIQAHADIGVQAMDRLTNSMLNVAATGPGGQAAVMSLALAFEQGGIDAGQFQIALDVLAQQHMIAADASALLAQRHGEQAAGSIAAADAALQHAQSLEEDAAKALIAAAGSEELAIKKQELAAQAQVAAQALLNSGAAGAAAAAQLANSSSLVDQLTAAYYRLAQAQAAAAQAETNRQAISDYRAGERSGGAVRTQKQEQARADARARRLREAEQAAKRGGKGKKGAAAVKLSDQQKLNNQLLAEQDKTHNRLQEAAENHYQKLLDIEKDYAEKSLQQQRQNEVSKRQSRADFYDSLTSATKDIGGEEAQRISAEYEAAYQKSQEIAQAGNAKLAADYLALKEQQLEAETQYQQARAQAIKESQEADDKEARKAAAAEAERLDRVRELQRQAEAEEEKQLLEGGDTNAQARARAIEEENARYQQQQADIIQSSDQATAAKITNAERAGKAIDRENLALQRQAELYAQIGAAQGAVPVVPPGASVAAPATAPGSVPVLDVGSLIAAIEAQTGALSGKLDGVIGAVGAVERAVSSARHVPMGG